MKTIAKMSNYQGTATIEFLEDAAQEYRWRVTARNGEIIGASTEGFSNIHNAKKNLTSLVLAVQEIAIEGWRSV